MATPNAILCVAEPNDEGGILATAHELVAAARKIADGGKVYVAIPAPESEVGDNLDSLAADVILCLVLPDVHADYISGTYDIITAQVTEIASTYRSSAVLMSNSDAGAVVGPRVAARLGGSFAADCIDVALNSEGRVAVTRPVHGGNALGVYEFAGDGAQVVTLRPGAFDPVTADSGREPASEDLDLLGGQVEDMTRGAELLDTIAEDVAGIPLESADIVVSGGRGLGGPEPFDELASLCEVLGAALGASRAACDAGWIDHSHQVGLTGKKISPTTYITVGISGASQHMAGCSSSKNIIAINRDPNASIFAHARFGVAGDWAKVLPAFSAACAELRSRA